MTPETHAEDDLLPARALAERFALLKLVLAGANIPILLLDQRLPIDELWSTIKPALDVSALFCIYMLVSWLALRRRWIALPFYRDITPFLDVVASVALILVTGGYLGPFNVWLFVAVVTTGFSGSTRLPLLAGAWALAAQFLIALVPQPVPLDVGLFIVRAGYNFGFAVMIALIANQLFLQASALAAIAKFGSDLSKVQEESACLHIFERVVAEVLGADEVRASLSEPLPAMGGSEVFPISNGEYALGECCVVRSKPLNARDRSVVRVLADRLCVSIRRIRLGKELIEAAARDERSRFADEMHDTHLQTLAAVDMHAEAARRRISDPIALQELETIKNEVRQAAAKTRRFIQASHDAQEGGPRIIRQILQERWPVGSELDIDSNVELTEGQWRAVGMLLQEGLNNAKNHGSAKQVRFSISRNQERSVAVLEADGKSPQVGVVFGYGLSRLDTVVRANGGEMSLERRKGSGSRLQASFPEGAQ